MKKFKILYLDSYDEEREFIKKANNWKEIKNSFKDSGIKILGYMEMV